MNIRFGRGPDWSRSLKNNCSQSSPRAALQLEKVGLSRISSFELEELLLTSNSAAEQCCVHNCQSKQRWQTISKRRCQPHSWWLLFIHVMQLPASCSGLIKCPLDGKPGVNSRHQDYRNLILPALFLFVKAHFLAMHTRSQAPDQLLTLGLCMTKTSNRETMNWQQQDERGWCAQRNTL